MISSSLIEQILPQPQAPESQQEDIEHILITLATQKLGSLTKLALELGIDEQQLKDWLNTSQPDLPETISDALETLVLGNEYTSPSLLLAVGGVKEMGHWQNLIDALSSDALHRYLFDAPSTGITQDRYLLCERLLKALMHIGMKLPTEFPKSFLLKDSDSFDELEHLIDHDPYVVTLSLVLDAMVSMQSYYVAFFDELHNDSEYPFEYSVEWEAILVDLAVYQALKDDPLYPTLGQFQQKTIANTHAYIEALKSHAHRHRLALRAELLHLVTKDHEGLYDYTEAEMMGLFPPRIHPDIYVNEMIESQRLLHKVLPALCLKCGMTEEELRNLAKE